MAFRGMTSPVQVRQLFCISQFNLLNVFFFIFCFVHIPRVRGPMNHREEAFAFVSQQYNLAFSRQFFLAVQV